MTFFYDIGADEQADQLMIGDYRRPWTIREKHQRSRENAHFLPIKTKVGTNRSINKLLNAKYCLLLRNSSRARRFFYVFPRSAIMAFTLSLARNKVVCGSLTLTKNP